MTSLHQMEEPEEQTESFGSTPALCGDTEKSFDAALFDFRSISPDVFAAQITLLDAAIFPNLTHEELSSCAWSGSRKLALAPNVVAFTRRANQTNFWVQHEILAATKLKRRVDVLSHFIKIAKELFRLKNLHGLMAVLAAFRSSPIHNLKRTWEQTKATDLAFLEKMSELFSEANNYDRLRQYIATPRLLPCIPYLGMFQRDLLFIDVAHPSTGGMESHDRSTKMNNILRVISEFQRSDYSSLPKQEHVMEYILSNKYIEELQRFVEDENYKLSIALEPKAAVARSKSMNVRCSRSPIATSTPARAKSPFYHKRNGSTGAGTMNDMKGDSRSFSLPIDYKKTNLIDDSVDNSSEVLAGSHDSLDISHLTSSIATQPIICSSCVKRKCTLRGGKRVSMSVWRSCWVELTDSHVTFFELRPLRLLGRSRTDFAAAHSYRIHLRLWLIDRLTATDTLLLQHPTEGHKFKLRFPSQEACISWWREIHLAIKRSQMVGPLISFDEHHVIHEDDVSCDNINNVSCDNNNNISCDNSNVSCNS